MGVDPLTLGLAFGGVSAATSLIGGIAQSAAQANADKAQAQALRNQASAVADAGQTRLAAIDKEKAQLRRQYKALQSANNVSLGASDVDPSSGSAMAVAEGNAGAFSQDIGDNAYSRMLADWQTRQQANAITNQADQLSARASYAERTAYNLFPSVLSAVGAGASGFMQGYSFGGKFPGGKSSGRYWDRALQDWSKTRPRH